ncbi:hypothetical protein BC830DRAFT_1157963 [Chytriomyces sp. MP71]|nr:hypothetical protein BC830DRAFT_1157963 [Chytriomyces sp. MP71]
MPETAASDPFYWEHYAAILPIMICGVCLNASVVASTLRRRSKLIVTRLDRILFLLLLVCLLWSMLSVVKFAAALATTDRVFLSWMALGSSLALMGAFAANVLLAMERLFVIACVHARDSQPYFVGYLLCMLIPVTTTVWVFATSVSECGSALVDRSHLTSECICTAILRRATTAHIVGIIAIYTATFRISTRKLRESFAALQTEQPSSKQELEDVRLRFERKILFNASLMATSLFLCYFPALAVSAAFALSPRLQYESIFGWIILGDVTSSLDVLVSPVLILYFGHQIRHAWLRSLPCFGKMRSGEGDEDEGLDLGPPMELQEPSETTSAGESSREFYVIRVYDS